MLTSLFRIEFGPIADSACHRRFRFRVHGWAMNLTLRPLHSVSTPNISQVWVSIVNCLTSAFIWYARIYFQCRIGSDGWLRVPSSASFSCASVGDDFDFEVPSLGEYAKCFTSVSVYCEGLNQSFLLICLPLFSESNWIVKMTPRAIVGVVFVCIGGRWFWLWGPPHSVSTPNISQVWVSIVKGETRAFFWYACLYFQSRIGSDGLLRVPSSASFSCASVGDGFDF